MPFLRLHDTRLRYRESGAQRPGPPLLFLHGAGASSAVWIGMLHRLGRRHRCVAPDLPGHGQSQGRVGSVDEMRDAVGAVAGTLCLSGAILVGHSLGGMIALAAARAWPEKVAGLILVTTSARLKVAPALMSMLETWTHWPEHFAEMGHSPDTPKETRRRSAGIACASSREQTIADFRAADAHDARPYLGEISTPTLVVSGAHDLLTPPKWGEALAAGLPKGKHVSLPCGHMPMHERPDELAAAIMGFPVGD